MEVVVQWSQIVMVVLMIIGLIYAWIQISIMKRSEADKKRLAVLSLIQELKYNKKLIDEYIDHDVNGANVKPNKDGKISYELNKPSLIAYERNVILACGNNGELLKEITVLYEKIDACKVLVDEVLLIVGNNLIDCMLSGNRLNFNYIVGDMNGRLSQEAKAVNELINGVIIKLEALYRNININWVARYIKGGGRSMRVRIISMIKKVYLRIILVSIGVVSCYMIIQKWGAADWDAIVALLMIITVIVAVLSMMETNLNARFCTGADLLIRLEERFTGEEIKRKRKKAIEAIKKGSYGDKNISTILDFFSVVAILSHKNALDTEIVWRVFSAWIIPYYISLKSHIEEMRKKDKDKKLYETLSKLYYECLHREAEEVRKEWEDKSKKNDKLMEFYKEEIEECS